MKVKGYSLLEIMMVIGITAVIMIIAVAYYTNVRMTEKINQTIMQVRDLYQAGVSYFSDQKYQGTRSTTNIVPDLIKGNYITASDQISPWGSNQNNTATLTFSSATNGNKLAITIPALPAKACMVIKSRLQGPFPNATYSSQCTSAQQSLTVTFILNFTE